MSTLPKQEPDHIDGRRTARIALVTLALAALAVGVSILPLRNIAINGARPAPNPPPTIGIVEQSPIDDAHRMQDAKQAQLDRLTHYRYLDDAHDLAEIPIDRAMKIRAEKRR